MIADEKMAGFVPGSTLEFLAFIAPLPFALSLSHR